MQKLQAKLKNVPADASQVRRSTSTALNRVQRPSAPGKVLTCNNPEGNLLRHTGGRNLRVSANVYVLNMRGEPLMSTTTRKARILLRDGSAAVAVSFPFTIRMKVPTGETRQETVLGIDSGYRSIGFSCISKKKELIGGELDLEVKTKDRLTEKRMYRRNRRNRLWYRKPRFSNRRRGTSWLPPSVERSYRAHLLLISRIRKLLPVSGIRIEVGNFDIQEIENPGISGTGYQRGDKYGYENIKAYLMSREKGICQLCGKSVKGHKVNLHHIISRLKGGTDRADNLALLHASCHEKLHLKKKENKLKKNREFKDATFMNTVRWRFKRDLDCQMTYGYRTFCDRNVLGLEKSHVNDAFVIAGGTIQERNVPFQVVQKRKNNRCLQLNRKGFAPSVRRQRYSLQPKDLVKVEGKIFEVVGVHCKGKSIIVKFPEGKSDIPIRKIQWSHHFNSIIFKQERTAIHPRSKDPVSLAA